MVPDGVGGVLIFEWVFFFIWGGCFDFFPLAWIGILKLFEFVPFLHEELYAFLFG